MDEELVAVGLGILFVLFILCFIIYSHLAYRKRKLMESLPTSKVIGVFIGLVEVKGTAECREYLNSFLAEAPCVYYSYKVEERWSKTEVSLNGKRRHTSGKTIVSSDEQSTAFFLKDDTGFLLVRPEGADIEGTQVFKTKVKPSDELYYAKGPNFSVPHSDNVRIFTETIIPLSSAVYILGQAQERDDCVAPEITQSDKALHYIISTRSEEEIVSKHKGKAWSSILVGLCLSMAPAMHFYKEGTLKTWHPMLYSGLIYCSVWAISWAWITYNILIEHRNRVRQAISLIDIQLQRRYDLIPQLCNVLSGYSQYEEQIFHFIAELRRLQASNESSSPTIQWVQEQYPNLKADALFINTQEEITQTENRLALARDYYNNIIKHFHDNIQTFPACLFAKTLGFHEFPSLAMESFTRAVPIVNFDTQTSSSAS